MAGIKHLLVKATAVAMAVGTVAGAFPVQNVYARDSVTYSYEELVRILDEDYGMASPAEGGEWHTYDTNIRIYPGDYIDFGDTYNTVFIDSLEFHTDGNGPYTEINGPGSVEIKSSYDVDVYNEETEETTTIQLITNDFWLLYGDGSDPCLYCPVSQQDAQHTHIWSSSQWANSDTHHWKVCETQDCPLTDDSLKDAYEEHTYGTEGEAVYTCSTCGYVNEQKKAEVEAAAKAARDKQKANEVTALIEAIGEVEYTPEVKEKIEAARAAYEALTEEQKALVEESYRALLTADEAKYEELTPVRHEVLNGDNQEYSADGTESLSIRFDGDPENFLALYIDEVLVGAENYDITKGSTIITLKPEFLKTLKPGEHKIRAVWKDGEGTATFKILEPAVNNAPNEEAKTETQEVASAATADTNSTSVWIVFMAVAAALAGAAVIRKRRAVR